MYTGVLKEIPLETTTAAAGGLPGGGRSMMAVTPGAINHTLFLVLIFSANNEPVRSTWLR